MHEGIGLVEKGCGLHVCLLHLRVCCCVKRELKLHMIEWNISVKTAVLHVCAYI